MQVLKEKQSLYEAIKADLELIDSGCGRGKEDVKPADVGAGVAKLEADLDAFTAGATDARNPTGSRFHLTRNRPKALRQIHVSANVAL